MYVGAKKTISNTAKWDIHQQTYTLYNTT